MFLACSRGDIWPNFLQADIAQPQLPFSYEEAAKSDSLALLRHIQYHLIGAPIGCALDGAVLHVIKDMRVYPVNAHPQPRPPFDVCCFQRTSETHALVAVGGGLDHLRHRCKVPWFGDAGPEIHTGLAIVLQLGVNPVLVVLDPLAREIPTLHICLLSYLRKGTVF